MSHTHNGRRCHIEGHIDRAPGECTHCVGGTISLPPALYDPADIPCPWCQPGAYPDGFPGLRDAARGHWLIPPSQ